MCKFHVHSEGLCKICLCKYEHRQKENSQSELDCSVIMVICDPITVEIVWGKTLPITW